jgi:hypothetical protein
LNGPISGRPLSAPPICGVPYSVYLKDLSGYSAFGMEPLSWRCSASDAIGGIAIDITEVT